jgi:formylglycine-generating enzyme required for sulfatase activity
MSHIFISYSKQNKTYARKLADQLKQEGFEVWIDDRIDYGDTWERAIFKAIDQCLAFVVIMTPESYESDWVLRECQYADKRKKPQFPVLLDGEEFPRYVSTQYADVRGGILLGENFLKRLSKFVVRGSLPPEQKEIETKPDIRTRIDSIMDGRLKKIPDDIPFTPPDVSHVLPAPFEWCKIPEGEVTVRFSPRAKATTLIPEFAISRYPITNAQFRVFEKAKNGYDNPEWWGFADGAKLWRRENPQPETTAFRGDLLPRTNVTWYEAVAFCQWLSSEINSNFKSAGKVQIMLPSEQQWQRAAQGDDGREYPWGNLFDAECCNSAESAIGQTSDVTRYENGGSPFEVLDMVGNVWEWCLSEWGTSQISLNSPGERVLRGGAWDSAAEDVTVNRRTHNFPGTLWTVVGFRIAAIFVA